MDAPIDDPTLSPGNVDAANASPDDPSRSPDRLPGAVFARRLVLKPGGVNSPVRRSPRLSCLPPPQLPIESHDTQGLDSSSDDESDSVNDVALHLSRDETPDNDDIPSDEPSSVLANRIIRAHDNPSPPPQDLAHPGINYMPGRDGQFPQPSVSIPPSPFRSINLLERLNQFSNPLFDHPHTQRTPSLGVRADMSEPSIISPRGSISLVSSSPSITSAPMERNIHENVTSTDTAPSYLQRTVDTFPPQSSHHLLAVVDTLESEALILPPTQVVDPPRTPVKLVASGGRLRGSLPYSEPRHSHGNSSLEESPVDQNLPSLREGRETECKATRLKNADANSFQKQHCLSTPSAEALAELDPPTKPTSSVEQMVLPVEFTENQPVTPSRPSTPSVTHPDFSRTSVQRPVIAPVRANDRRKSPSKLLLEMDDVRRTPAQRIPIETVLACGNASLQRAVQLSTVQDQSQLGCFSTIRTPAFSRRALNDRSRSPAKRIPIADTAASPARGHQTQCSPPRLAIRARSTSVEPRPSATTFARCQSVEPCATTTLRPDNHRKMKESIFPMVPVPPRAGTRLPFPLVSVQKSNGDPPPPIPEEHENAETGNTSTDTMLARPMKDNTTSQLRQPVTSRIPRIGNKPYAKPPKNARTTARATTGIATRAPAPPFKLACKNSRVGNSDAEVSSMQSASDQPLMGSLKRKRGAEVTVPPNLHPLIIRQVVPGVLSEKYAPKPVKLPSQARAPVELSPPKAPQPLKFRKVVDGMLSARYASAKATAPQRESPPSPLSDLSSLSDEGSPDETPAPGPSVCPQSEMSDNPQVNANAPVAEPSNHKFSPSRQDADGDKHSSRPRRTSRARKPAQQQYVIDVFSDNASTRPPPARRKPLPRTDGDCFMGMSATALKALTTSNTTKNQQIVAVLATEVIRKEGLRPESPTVRARTILQKQRDERDVRRRERAQRRAKMSEEILGCRDGQQQSGLDDVTTLATHEERDENDCDVQRKHSRGPGDEEDYEIPERPERAVLEPLRLEGLDKKVKPVKQVKWHQGLSTAIYIDQVDPKPKFVPKNVVVRGCLAPTSKNLPLDSLGNLVDLEGRPFPELATEHIVVKRYLYDNDVEPEPIPPKVTRSRSKKSKA